MVFADLVYLHVDWIYIFYNMDRIDKQLKENDVDVKNIIDWDDS